MERDKCRPTVVEAVMHGLGTEEKQMTSGPVIFCKKDRGFDLMSFPTLITLCVT